MSEIKERTVYLMQRSDKVFDGTDVYVGSTSRSLRERLWSLRGAVTRTGNENNRLYKKMREVGLGNWKMIPLLSFTCDKKTILEFEKEWCNALNADLNTYSPVLTPDERKQYNADYREFNKEKIKKQKADYYESKKEAIKQKQADNRELNRQEKKHHCELCGKSFWANWLLQKHLKTSRHFWKYICSVD